VSITGNGLKTQEAVSNDLPYPVVIDPKLSEFDALLAKQTDSSSKPTEPRKVPATV
jgi:hypothetical protein